MTKQLEGKTALVTGAARNLGRAFAERLAASGALVAINYASNDAAAKEALAAIESAGGQGFLVKQHLGPNGTGEALAKALAAELTKRTGSPKLDILVNNVGGGNGGDIASTTPDEFDWTFNNNVRSPFFLTQALLPNIRDGGRIINISSSASRLALPETISYCMAKVAVDMFTLVLAKDLGPRGITVNSVQPGYNETEGNMHLVNDPAANKMVSDMTLFGRFGRPSDIAALVHALALPEMGWVTGQCIEASGGFKLV